MKRKGNAGENRVARKLREDGALVGSMRESSDPGDLIALYPLGVVDLVEVKANREGGAFANFRRPAREALAAAAIRYGARAWLAYAPPGRPIRWIHSSKWPS